MAVFEFKALLYKWSVKQMIYRAKKLAIYGFKAGGGVFGEVAGFRVVLRWLEGSEGLVGWLQAAYSVLDQLS